MLKLFRKNSNLCDHNPPTSDGQTDDMRSQHRPRFALCTIVHRAVKTEVSLQVTFKEIVEWAGT